MNTKAVVLLVVFVVIVVVVAVLAMGGKEAEKGAQQAAGPATQVARFGVAYEDIEKPPIPEEAKAFMGEDFDPVKGRESGGEGWVTQVSQTATGYEFAIDVDEPGSVDDGPEIVSLQVRRADMLAPELPKEGEKVYYMGRIADYTDEEKPDVWLTDGKIDTERPPWAR